MAEEQIIYSQQPSYFHIIPNIADEELNPYEYRLLGHYLRVCGANHKICFESIRTTAEKCKMSHPMVLEARKRLVELGYLQLHETEYEKQRRIVVTILDFWPRNIQHFADRAAAPRQPSFAELIEAQIPPSGSRATTPGSRTTTPGNTATTPGNIATGGGSQVSHKNNNIKNNKLKKNKEKKNGTEKEQVEEKHDDADLPFFTSSLKEKGKPRAIARGIDRAVVFKALTQEGRWFYDNDYIWRLGLNEEELLPVLMAAVERALKDAELYQLWDGVAEFLNGCTVRQLQHLCLWLFKWVYDKSEWADGIKNPIGLFSTQIDTVPALQEWQKVRLAWCLCYWLSGVYETWRGEEMGDGRR